MTPTLRSRDTSLEPVLRCRASFTHCIVLWQTSWIMGRHTTLSPVGLVCILVVFVRNVEGNASHACEDGVTSHHRFCDQTLDVETRVQDVIASLTTPEKIRLLINDASGVPRLGIPRYEWWNEALHGVAFSPGVSFAGPSIFKATSFPQPILTSSSFNATLFNKIGQVISKEAREFYNAGQAGLTYWTPNINLFRDPRWGRGQETPGEDPHLTSIYAEYFVRGLQEESDYDGNASRPAPRKLQISACCKHFTAYDLDAWEGVERYSFNAVVSQQDLADSFNPPFEACVKNGRASGLMCSYNAVNGVPSCADKNLLTNIARGNWAFDGYIVSDCDAVQNVYLVYNHNYTQDPESAVAAVLEAGMDINCGYTLSNYTASALRRDLVSEEEINLALTHLFTVQFRLGLFDGNPPNRISADLGNVGEANSTVCSDEHQGLALEAAQQGIVLLKNDENILPLARETINNLAVIGPNANDTLNTMLGNYAGNPCNYITPLQGLSAYVAATHYVAGCRNGTSCDTADIHTATSLAAGADATIIVVGLALEQEREAFDRTSLLLPGMQQQLVLSVAKRAKGSVVMIVVSGGPVDISFARDEQKIAAILWAGYPGEAGGQALAQIIFGDRNPGGKLPMTWYPEVLTNWPMTNMNMRPNASSGYPGRTYRFYTGETVYKFGDGLTYSIFVHSFVNNSAITLIAPTVLQLHCYHDADGCSEADARYCNDMEFTTEVDVENIHWRAGTDVVLLFTSPPGVEGGVPTIGLPFKQLIGFQGVHVEGKDVTKVQFLVKPCIHFITTTVNGTSMLLEGIHILSTSGGMKLPIELTRV